MLYNFWANFGADVVYKKVSIPDNRSIYFFFGFFSENNMEHQVYFRDAVAELFQWSFNQSKHIHSHFFLWFIIIMPVYFLRN